MWISQYCSGAGQSNVNMYPGSIIRDNPRVQSEAEVFANYVSKPAKTERVSATD